MGTGIVVCGLNGAGKSTLGKALAKRLGFRFIDIETLYFDGTSKNASYADPRSREEAVALLMREVREYPNFVFSAVKGDYGEEILPYYTHIVQIEVPKQIRMQRIRDRSFAKFGERMLAGGDLYEQEEDFFRMAASRAEDYTDRWVQAVTRPVFRVDGMKPIYDNVEYIVNQLKAWIS